MGWREMSNIWEMSASEIAAAVRAKSVSAAEVTQAHLARLSDVNPQLNAVVQEFPEEALAQARALDDRIAAGEDPGLLAGVPVTIKVNVDQEGHATTNGLKLQKDLIATQDSPVVSNIRKAGGIIVGRTNTPAFSLRWFTRNDLHGQTLNPRDPGLTPGGSSGGAASAVAAGICALGHGTDIAGSVRYPAYACGLHGLRPTLGRIPAWNSTAPDRFIGAQLMAVSGPITRTMDDIDLSLRVMAASDARDPWWTPAPLEHGPFTRRVALCVAPDGMPVAPEVEQALRRAADALRDAGWQVDEVEIPSMRAAADINAKLWMAETQLAARDAIRAEGEPDSQFVFEQMTRDEPEPTLESLMVALRDRVTLMRDWQVFMERYPLILCPVSGELPFALQEDVSSPEAFRRIMEAQLVQRGVPAFGAPALSVSTGAPGETPVGVQLIADQFREDILISAGRVIEDACGIPTVCDPVRA